MLWDSAVAVAVRRLSRRKKKTNTYKHTIPRQRAPELKQQMNQ